MLSAITKIHVWSVHFRLLFAPSDSKFGELLGLQERFHLTWLVLYEVVCVRHSWMEQMPKCRNNWSQTSFGCRQLRNRQLFSQTVLMPPLTFKTITVWRWASVHSVCSPFCGLSWCRFDFLCRKHTQLQSLFFSKWALDCWEISLTCDL